MLCTLIVTKQKEKFRLWIETLGLQRKVFFFTLHLPDYVEQNCLLLKWFAAHSSILGKNVSILNWIKLSCLNGESDVIFITHYIKCDFWTLCPLLASLRQVLKPKITWLSSYITSLCLGITGELVKSERSYFPPSKNSNSEMPR
jgi:hypothetical protein